MYFYLPSLLASRIRVLFVVLMLSGLAACGANPLSLLTGGGPNVAANTQAGKTNSQTVGTTSNTDQSIVRPQARDIRQSSDTNKVQADRVETVVVNEVPVWVILLLILGWLFPSPNEIGRYIRSIFRLKCT